MAPLNSHADLSIAEIAFYSPALLLALFLTFRHGFSKSLGWFYLVTLSLLRLIGASCELYIITQNDYSVSLLEAAAITSSIGTAPLLLALEGLLQRVNTGLRAEGRDISMLPFQAIRTGALAGLVLAIIGGTEEPRTPALYKQGSTGTALIQAASVIFLTIYLVLVFLTIVIFPRKNHALPGETGLLYAGAAALPFLLVRVIYIVLVTFFVSNDFFYRDVNVYLQSFMQFLMEAIVVIIFIVAGIRAPKQAKLAPSSAGRDDVEGMGMGNMPSQKTQQPQRSIGDYRPSRMIRNALRGN